MVAAINCLIPFRTVELAAEFCAPPPTTISITNINVSVFRLYVGLLVGLANGTEEGTVVGLLEG